MKTLPLLCVVVLTAASPLVISKFARPSASDSAAAAQKFLDSLDEEQRAAANLEFGDPKRQTWHFVPGMYPGVLFQDLNLEQKQLMHGLLHTVLSSAGYHKTTTIMQLEDVLREISEARGRAAPTRDAGRYSLAVFGAPGGDDPWGFRLQGHHISWNFSSANNEIISTTPAFLGSNPAEIREGPYAGLRALPEEEDIARALLGSLSPEQEMRAILQLDVPTDILWNPDREKDILGTPKGLPYSAMSESQRVLLERLVETYVHNLQRDIADAQLAGIRAAGLDGIHFAWIGAKEKGRGHYYRIHGPTFAIEYDNT